MRACDVSKRARQTLGQTHRQRQTETDRPADTDRETKSQTDEQTETEGQEGIADSAGKCEGSRNREVTQVHETEPEPLKPQNAASSDRSAKFELLCAAYPLGYAGVHLQ